MFLDFGNGIPITLHSRKEGGTKTLYALHYVAIYSLFDSSMHLDDVDKEVCTLIWSIILTLHAFFCFVSIMPGRLMQYIEDI